MDQGYINRGQSQYIESLSRAIQLTIQYLNLDIDQVVTGQRFSPELSIYRPVLSLALAVC